ncbi:Response regulator containing CheY-like receiver domain and AraC-type DNA-binding domain [Butyrivibrio fibrisolvens 16/4]|nr:Response regulator containing CheY-like receiver domain and AraC-type DNA-binding domain [Butyrivibrio fibrisolvens 16/4]
MNKILVVEDEKLIRQGISAMIKRSGVPYEEVIECSNGLQALDILKTTRIDVMLTDIRMPKMNGIELVQAVQELDNPPLSVAVSGYDDFSYAVEMMRQGVREYILKPVERDKLKEVLTKLDEELNNRRLDEEKTELTDTKLLKYFLQDSGTTSDDIKLIAKK